VLLVWEERQSNVAQWYWHLNSNSSVFQNLKGFNSSTAAALITHEQIKNS
jgi:hypothetical protein